jgi:hypothetical protein
MKYNKSLALKAFKMFNLKYSLAPVKKKKKEAQHFQIPNN